MLRDQHPALCCHKGTDAGLLCLQPQARLPLLGGRDPVEPVRLIRGGSHQLMTPESSSDGLAGTRREAGRRVGQPLGVLRGGGQNGALDVAEGHDQGLRFGTR